MKDKELNVIIGKGGYKVRARALRTLDGIILIITGGEKPHVGAVAVGVPRESLRYEGVVSANVSILSRIGHKDDEVAKIAAEEVASALNEYTVAIVGIHIESATEEDISKLLDNAQKAIDAIIDRLKA